MKFHITAISTITLVITVMFFLIGPDLNKPQATQATGDRFIQVYSATWGTNCNPTINNILNKQRQNSVSIRREDLGADALTLEVKPAFLNNVLPQVGERCNGMLSCKFAATSANLGNTEPMANCYKRLLISYRCYDLDRLWNIDVGQGDDVFISCSAADDEASGRALD